MTDQVQHILCVCHCLCFLTKPSLLVSLHFNSKAKVCQLHCCSLHLTGQQQVLRLRDRHIHTVKQNVGQEIKTVRDR